MGKISASDIQSIVNDVANSLENNKDVIAIPDIVSITEMSIEELEQIRDMLAWAIIEARKRLNEEESTVN